MSANYPFATIEPNVGVTEVPDERLPVLAEIVGTDTIKPALVKFTDIAGLIEGAAQGEGLGNKFLAHIRETDAVCHVLRAFEDTNVIREGSVNPVVDLATIRTELQIADLETIDKQKEPKGTTDKEELKRWEYIQEFKQRLEQGKNAMDTQKLSLSREQLSVQQKNKIQLAKELNLLTFKPELFVINVDEAQLSRAEEIKKEYASKLSTQEQPINAEQIVVISAQIESELAVLSQAEQKKYLQDLGFEQSGLERLAEVAYQTLGLQSFLTAGEKEVRAWTIRQGATAVEAAGVIHTDFQKNFIKAKVVRYQDFVDCGGWVGAKEAGKIRIEGRNYIMRPDDIADFAVGR